MKIVLTLLTSAALLAGVSRAADAAPATTSPAPAAPTAPAKPADDLHALMKSMGRDFKALNQDFDDAGKIDAARALVKKLIATAGKCVDCIPAKADKIPEADRAKFIAAYKVEIGKLVADFQKIDDALAKKDLAGAKAAAADCNMLKKEDHREFMLKK